MVPLWTRRWWLYVPIGAWFAVNPVVTPPAHDTSSFATRAILGEESWVEAAYAAAWEEWAVAGDEDTWASASSDGLTDAAR